MVKASVGEDYFDRSLFSAPFNTMSLFSNVPNSTAFSCTIANLTRICIVFGIPFVAKPLNTHLLGAKSLNSLHPSQTHPVPGDGNCLFSALAVSIGSQYWYHSQLRQRICLALPSVDIAPHFLEIYTTIDGNVVVETASNVNEYLNRSGMRSNGVYGTCVEIYAFAQIAVADVYVYHCMTKLWIVYSYAGDRASMDVPSVFLVHTHTGNHFETVAVLSAENPNSQQSLPHGCVQSSFPDTASQCNVISASFHANTSDPKGSACSEFKVLPHLCDEGLTSPSVGLGGMHNDLLLPSNSCLSLATIECEENGSKCDPLSPGVCFNALPQEIQSTQSAHNGTATMIMKKDNACRNEDASSDNCVLTSTFSADKAQNREMCGKCCRISTPAYPLQWQTLEKTAIKRRRFGLRPTATCLVCQSCFNYNNGGNCWRYAWPSVIHSLLKDLSIRDCTMKKFVSFLPPEIRDSWAMCQHLHPAVSMGDPSVLVDITKRKEVFLDKINSGNFTDLEEALDNECYPNCRCPFGCFTFVEETGRIGFNHLVNGILPSFTSFSSDYLYHLRGARDDWLKPMKVLDAFDVSGFVSVNGAYGLVIGTCVQHNNGSHLQYLHPPAHPSLGRLSVPTNDRLAFVAPNLRILKNAKANYASHTFQLLKAVGNYSGISSIRLSSQRRWDITSDLLVKAESQCSFYRSDIQYFLNSLVSSGETTDEIRQGIQSKPNIEQSAASLSASTSVSITDTYRLFSSPGLTDGQRLCAKFKSVTFAQPPNSFGSSPPKILSCKTHFLSLLQTLFCISPQLCRSISDSAGVDNAIFPLLQFLDPVIFPRFRRCTRKTVDASMSDGLSKLFTRFPESPSRCLSFGVSQFCDDVIHENVASRQDIWHFLEAQEFEGVNVILFSYAGVNTLRSKFKAPLNFQTAQSVFELKFIATEGLATRNNILLRHGGVFQSFWVYKSKSIFPEQVRLPCDRAVDHFINDYWNICVYYRQTFADISELRSKYFETLAGQGKFFCKKHSLLLTRDFPSSGFKCSCGRSSFLRCPVSGCLASVCRMHSEDESQEKHFVFDGKKRIFGESTKNSACGSSQLDDCSYSRVSVDSENRSTSPTNTVASSEFVTNPGLLEEDSEVSHVSLPVTTAAGDSTVVLERDFRIDSTDFQLPLHVLLNGQCGLLKRSKGSPLYVAARHKRFLENITATSPPNSVPLLQPEAMLFPSIFWHQNTDGSYSGAIPSPLYNDHKQNELLGFASLEQHLQTRLKDSSLLTSTDPRYVQYVFDTIFNLQLRVNDTRIVLNRGWSEAARQRKNVHAMREGAIFFDQCDSRKNVNELGAALKERPATYFFTYTCGQSTHPGLRKIFSALDAKFPKDVCKEEDRKSAIQSEMVTMLRAWERASRLVMKYIETSPEQPLGKVNKIWYRYEFQDEACGFPHVHALIWTAEDCFSEAVRSRICCSATTFLGNLLTEVGSHNYSLDELNELRDLFNRYQSHSCFKAKFRCQKKTDKLKRKTCRMPKYPPSANFTYKCIHKELSEETIAVLKNIGLAESSDFDCSVTIDQRLCGGKHHYPTESNTHTSPTNAKIFALVRSSTNLQICDIYMSSRYLSKYVAGVEERAEVSISTSSATDLYDFHVDQQVNNKIAGVYLTNMSKEEKPKKKCLNSRILSLTESVWWSLRFPYVVTNIQFIHVVTAPREKRAGIVIEPKCRLSSSNQGPLFGRQSSIRHSKDFPPHRCFTVNQKLLIIDAEKSSLSPDKITVFGVRPPELTFVLKVENYFTWFCRFRKPSKLTPESLLKRNVTKSYWVDGLGYCIYLNALYKEAFFNYCRNFSSGVRRFSRQCHEAIACTTSSSSHKFIYDKKVCQTQVVLSNVVPRNTTNFLTHILLSLGEYVTELDIFSQSNMKSAFFEASLARSHLGCEDSEVIDVVRRFVLEQLRYYPGSSTLLDRFVTSAYLCIQQAAQNNSVVFPCSTPRVLEQSIVQQSDSNISHELNAQKESLLCAIANGGYVGLPTYAELMNATLARPFTWSQKIHKARNQTDESLHDQQNILDYVCSLYDNYCSCTTAFIKHQFIVGPPGTGKSHVLIHCVIAALARGLRCVITSVAAERASLFGGRHINALIPFPVVQNGTVTHLVSHALNTLARDPLKFTFLERLDVLFVEEVSMISAELWSAMDNVLQAVSENNLPFGGKIVICTGDFRQLPPPTGTFLLLSNSVLANFEVRYLKHYVRMQNQQGKRLLDLLSEYPVTEACIKECCEIIDKFCIFVSTWTEVPLDILRVFSTRVAEKEAVEERISFVTTHQNIQSVSFHCKDEMSNTGTQNWVTATAPVSKFLNRSCLEPESLFIHVGCVLRLTCNLPSLKLFQGQLCLVESFDENDPHIVVRVAPAGVRSVSSNNPDVNSWRLVVVRKRIGVLHKYSNSTVCRRVQFPLKMYVASTVHKIMGDTVPSLATQIVGGKKFSYWLKEQLYVVVSRVTDLSHITFVGDKQRTLDAINLLCRKDSHLVPLIDNFLSSRGSCNSGVSAIQTFYPFPLRVFDVPLSAIGYCYLLVSVKRRELFYIGSCKTLRRRLQEHNSGNGSAFTKPVERRPWALVAYVTGFSNAVSRSRYSFEQDWQRAMVNHKYSNVMLTLADYLSECHVLMDLYKVTGIETALECDCMQNF